MFKLEIVKNGRYKKCKQININQNTKTKICVNEGMNIKQIISIDQKKL